MVSNNIDSKIIEKIIRVKMVLTDCDGVLTDGFVYYSHNGEVMKKFSLRDGMGVERLRELLGIETGIITGENSEIVKKRAEKLNITEYHFGVKDKLARVIEISKRKSIDLNNIAYIGDDYNDLEVIKNVGLSACPSDALPEVKKNVDIILSSSGGNNAFREFAEIIITHKKKIL